MGRKRTKVLSYTERESRIKPFDWQHALKYPGMYDSGTLSRKAKNWVTCACGTLCELIPRYNKSTMDGNFSSTKKDGAPIDWPLRKLGISFYSHVENENWKAAKTTLDKIEKRSAQIIAELQLDC